MDYLATSITKYEQKAISKRDNTLQCMGRFIQSYKIAKYGEKI